MIGLSDAVWEALAGALRPPAGTPRERVGALVAGVGGIGPLARLLTGLPAAGRLPGAGTAERRAYLAERRSIERYLRGERTPASGRLERLAGAVFRRVDSSWRRGIVIELAGALEVNGYCRPGRTATILIPSGPAGDLVDAFEDGDRGTFDELLGDDALADYYGVDDLTECGEVEITDVRPVAAA